MSEKISVVMPVFNIEKYVERCAYSILNQTYVNLEIIMIDDGSTDGSGKIIDQIVANDSRVKVIHKENGGVTSARMAGIKSATGEWIGFVDGDDEVELQELFAVADAGRLMPPKSTWFEPKLRSGLFIHEI